MIAKSAIIEENVVIGKNVIVGERTIIKSGSILESNCIIGDDSIIENNAYIDVSAIIRNNVHLGEGSFVGARSILGEYMMDFIINRKNSKAYELKIGKNAIIRSETIIYGNNIIGDNFQTGHRVTIRENSVIGSNVRLGTLSDIQGYCEIGNYTSLHSNVHIGQKSKIGNYVWIFPYVVLTNDPNPPSETMLGVTIEDFAVIATSSTVLPGIKIGTDSLVGAGAVVTKDVPEGKIVVGNPGKEVGDTSKITDKITNEKVYPWRYTFDRGMPWEGIGYDKWKETEIFEKK